MRSHNKITVERRFLFSRILSALLIVSMVFSPSYAHALRPTGLEESPAAKDELSNRLRQNSASSSLEEKPAALENPSPALYGLETKNGVIEAPDPDKLSKYLEHVVVPFWVIVPRWTEKGGKAIITRIARVEVQPIPPENPDRVPIRLVVLDSEKLTDAELDRMREDSLRYINEREWLGVIDPTSTPEKRDPLRRAFAALISGNHHHFNTAVRHLVRSPKISLSALTPYRSLLALNGWYRHGPEGSLWADSNPGPNVVYVPSGFSPADLKRFVRQEWGMAAVDEHPWFFALFDQVARTPVEKITLDENPGLIRQPPAETAIVGSGETTIVGSSSAQTVPLPPINADADADSEFLRVPEINPGAQELVIRRFTPGVGPVGETYNTIASVLGNSLETAVESPRLAQVVLLAVFNKQYLGDVTDAEQIQWIYLPEGVILQALQDSFRFEWARSPQKRGPTTAYSVAFFTRVISTPVEKMVGASVPPINVDARRLVIRRFKPGEGKIGQQYQQQFDRTLKLAKQVIHGPDITDAELRQLAQISVLLGINSMSVEGRIEPLEIREVYFPEGMNKTVFQDQLRSYMQSTPEFLDASTIPGKPEVLPFVIRLATTPVGKMVEAAALVPPINTDAPILLIRRYRIGESPLGTWHQASKEIALRVTPTLRSDSKASNRVEMGIVIGLNAAGKSGLDPLAINELNLPEGMDLVDLQKILREQIASEPGLTEVLSEAGASKSAGSYEVSMRLAVTPTKKMVETVPSVNPKALPLTIIRFLPGVGEIGGEYNRLLKVVETSPNWINGDDNARAVLQILVILGANSAYYIARGVSDSSKMDRLYFPEGVDVGSMQQHFRTHWEKYPEQTWDSLSENRRAFLLAVRCCATPVSSMKEQHPPSKRAAPMFFTTGHSGFPLYSVLQKPPVNLNAPVRVVEIDLKQVTDKDLDLMEKPESGPTLFEESPELFTSGRHRAFTRTILATLEARENLQAFIAKYFQRAANDQRTQYGAKFLMFYLANQWWHVHAADHPEIRDSVIVVPKGWTPQALIAFLKNEDVWISFGYYAQSPALAKHGRWFWELGNRIASTPVTKIKKGSLADAQARLDLARKEAETGVDDSKTLTSDDSATDSSGQSANDVISSSTATSVISSGETARDLVLGGKISQPDGLEMTTDSAVDEPSPPVWKHADVSLPDRIHAQGNIESISDWGTFLELADPDALAATTLTERDREQQEGSRLLADLLNGLIRWDLEQWVISQARASIPWKALHRSLAEEDYPGSYRASLLSLLLRSVDRDQLIRLLGDASFITHLEQLHRDNDFMEGATGPRASIPASVSQEDLVNALVAAIQAHDQGLGPSDTIALGATDAQIRDIIEGVLRTSILPVVQISSLADLVGRSADVATDIQKAIKKAKETVEKGVKRSTNGGSSTKAAREIREPRVRVFVVEMILTRRSLLTLYRTVYPNRKESQLMGELSSAGRLDELFVAEAVQQGPNQIPDLFSILGVTIERRPERVWTWAADHGEWQVNVALLDKGLKSQLGKFKNDENATWHETTVRIGTLINYYRGWDFAQIWGILTGDGRMAYIRNWADEYIPKPTAAPKSSEKAGGLEESGDPIIDGLNALYAAPDLFRTYFGNRQGTFSRGGTWANFLQAVSDDEDGAIADKENVYAKLDQLPKRPRGMSAYRMHADLLVHKQSGKAIVVLGAPGTGKSLLSAVAAGDPERGYSSPGDSAAWEYRVDDWVLVVKIGSRFYAGLPPENVNKLSSLKTRLPLSNAVRVEDEDSGGAIRYETQLQERPGFVPLEAVVWLNNQEHLQQTRNWDLIFGNHTEWKSWSRGFFNQFMALPFREIILPEAAEVKQFDSALLKPSLEAADSIQKWFKQVTSAGLEERRALRFDPAVNDMILIKETSTSWVPLIPSAPQQMIAPNNPPWAIQVPESELRSLAEFLFEKYKETLAKGYSLQTADSNIVDRIAQVYPGIPGLDSYRGLLDLKKFTALVEMLHYQLYQRAGAEFIFAPVVNLITYATIERPWKQVPYLDGRAFTWETRLQTQLKQKEPSGFVRGWAFRNISAYDPGQARSQVEFDYREFLAQAKSYGIPLEAIALVRSLYEGQTELFLNYFGEQVSRDEELNHARDYLWAAYFFSDVFSRPELDAFQKHFVTEAVIRPNSPLDQTVWNPEKVRNEPRSMNDLVEISGQTQGAVDLMSRLVQEQRDDFAEAFFWFYLFEKFRETGLQPGKATPGRDRTAAEWVLNYVRKTAGQDMNQVHVYLRSTADGQSALTPGKNALALIQGFHDENFLTETDRIAMLEKAVKRQPVSLGARQPATSGLEEGQRLFKPVGVIASQQRLLILTPDMAVESARVLHLFKPYQGEKIPVAIIVDDLEQKQAIESLLPNTVTAQWTILSETSDKKWQDVVVDIQLSAWQREIGTYVIQMPSDLEGLGKFLGIAPVDERTYQEWVQAVATDTAA